MFEPAIIQLEEAESTDTPAKPETVIVERFTAVPLPGQMKLRETYIPRRQNTGKPHEVIDAANAGAKVGPNPDAYVNAIQVYPSRKARSIRSSQLPSK